MNIPHYLQNVQPLKRKCRGTSQLTIYQFHLCHNVRAATTQTCSRVWLGRCASVIVSPQRCVARFLISLQVAQSCSATVVKLQNVLSRQWVTQAARHDTQLYQLHLPQSTLKFSSRCQHYTESIYNLTDLFLIQFSLTLLSTIDKILKLHYKQ